MRIEGHITAVEDRGETIQITGQGRKVASAEWQPWLSIQISVPASDMNKKTYHLGRDIGLTLDPA